MPLPLHHHADRLLAEIVSMGRGLLGTDFDGTLVPLHDDPDACWLDEPTRTILAAVHSPPRMHVAIVSGRRLTDIRARVGLEAVTYAGNHGLEIEGHGMRFREPAAVARADVLRSLADDLAVLLAGIDGAHVEWKGLSVTVHVRRVPTADVTAVRAVVAHAVSRTTTTGHLRVRGGKDVIEIRPDVDWDKGRAIAWLADRLGYGPAETIFIGDDETDEDAFVACHRGITIRVGDPDAPTAARYIATATDVHRFLALLASRVTGW
jgi:trehalose 6-phosphate phosphatase